MEFIPGESLKDVVERNPNGMPPEEVEHWFRGIAAGVSYLHDRGIVHRDLKPGNIFDDEGLVKIGDYGLSKFISASRRSGQTESVGTFHYMAPEIGRGIYGKEIDIYALGIMLYEMLTGRVPFDGESSQEIIMKHLTDNPDLTDIAQPYRAVIQRALQKDPEKRYRSVQAMLDGLDHASADDAASQTAFLESRVAAEEPLYIGLEDEKPEMEFGDVRHHHVVNAELVPPVRSASPSAVAAPRSVQQTANRRSAGPAASTRHKLTGGQMSGPAKTLLLIAIVLVIYFNPWLVPLAIVVAGVYGVYLGARALFCWRGKSRGAGGNGCMAAGGGDAVMLVAIRDQLRKKPASERVSELTGSMLLAAMISAILCLVFLLLQGDTLDGTVSGWATYAWLTATSTFGAWAMLAVGKFWEGDPGDHFSRRFAMLAVGLAIGLAAFVASEVFVVNLLDHDEWTVHTWSDGQLVDKLYTSDGAPMLAAFLLYFAGLFVVLRWWTQMDPLRRTRLSIWATATCVLWAWIMHMFCRFPQPWGFVVAATISVSVQLAAPWISRRDRQTIGPV
jgi:hypothetical protein